MPNRVVQRTCDPIGCWQQPSKYSSLLWQYAFTHHAEVFVFEDVTVGREAADLFVAGKASRQRDARYRRWCRGRRYLCISIEADK
jgi:hypothetical protein